MKNKSSVRTLVTIALMVAISFILMYFGISIIPAAPHLKLEFSFLPIVILALGVDVKKAILASLCVNILDFILKGSLTGLPIDQLINFCAISIFLICVTTIYKLKRNKFYIVLCVLIVTVLMVLINFIFTTPLYFGILGYPLPDNLLWYCISIYGPFNLIKWGLVGIFIFVANDTIKLLVNKVKSL